MGGVLWGAVAGKMIPSVTALLVFGGVWLLDILTLNLQSRFWYKRGYVYMALSGWHVMLLFVWGQLRKTVAAEAAWTHLDLGQEHEASALLARNGSGAAERNPLYAVSLARLLLLQKARTLLAMNLADAALAETSLARAHYVRGCCYLELEEFRPAMRAFHNARVRATEKRDKVLSGLCYLYLGLCWDGFGEKDYARDHFLRAEIMLFFLPRMGQLARSRLNGNG